jgi:potassium channel subfamily K, other eukaryote
LSDRFTGSGLTRRQRTLVIIIMVLFCYICVGALIISLIEKLSFIDGLYFTLVSIETIGFGDIVPTTTGSRLFLCVYSAIGILNLGVAIGMCRETVLEAMEVAYRKRAQKVKERWKEGRKRRRIEARWKRGIEWRLKEMGVPIWIRDENRHEHRSGRGSVNTQNRSTIIGRVAGWTGFTDRKIGQSHIMHGPTGMRLNLSALTRTQLEASALEAGVSLDTLLPSDIIPATEETATHTDARARPNTSEPRSWIHHPLASHFKNVFRPTQARTLTHARLGGMSALLTRFAVAAVHKHAVAPDKPFDAYVPSQPNGNAAIKTALSGETLNNFQTSLPPMAQVNKRLSHLDFNSTRTRSSDNLALQMMRDLDAKVFYSKLIIAWSLFFVFWAVSDRLAPFH